MEKNTLIRGLLIAVCGGFCAASPCFSGSGASEYRKAMEYIDSKGGEVYIKFPLARSPRLDTLDCSIDALRDGEVFAYLNKREFASFIAAGIPYTVLPHPGDLLTDPVMSDYSGGHYRIDKYPTYEGYLKIMADFETNYPGLCKIYTIGESVQGRKLLVATISDSVTVREKEPRYYLSATIHGDETAGYVIALNLMDLLLSKYDSDARIKRIVDSAELWICPLMNPDGTYRGGNSSVFGARRNNANDIDLNRDFPDPVSGPYPNGSRQKETENFVAFEKEYDFVMSSDLHGGSEVACYPWGCNWSKKAADDEWWKSIARNYASLAQKNGPAGYFTDLNNGVVNGCDWYPVSGGRMSYMLYFRHTRLLTLELSREKLLAESKLMDYWNYNREALLGHIEELFYGIRGTVTDTVSGKGIKAKVFMKNFDTDSSFVYGMAPYGDYYRPISKGIYDVEFSHPDYFAKTIFGVSVDNGKAAIADVQLRPKGAGTGFAAMPPDDRIVISRRNGAVIIHCPVMQTITRAGIYSADGSLVRQFCPENGRALTTITWDGKDRSGAAVAGGCYFCSIQTPEAAKTVQFTVLK